MEGGKIEIGTVCYKKAKEESSVQQGFLEEINLK